MEENFENLDLDIDEQIKKIKAQMTSEENSSDAVVSGTDAGLDEQRQEESFSKIGQEFDFDAQAFDEIQEEFSQKAATFQDVQSEQIFEEELIEPSIDEKQLLQEPPAVQAEQEFLAEACDEEWDDPFKEFADEINAQNEHIKKYVFKISEDLTPFVEDISVEKRNDFINKAIRLKRDYDKKEDKVFYSEKMIKHATTAVITFVVALPIVFWLSYKSLEATHANYSYVQGNFEKLYREQAKKTETKQKIYKLYNH